MDVFFSLCTLVLQFQGEMLAENNCDLENFCILSVGRIGKRQMKTKQSKTLDDHSISNSKCILYGICMRTRVEIVRVD